MGDRGNVAIVTRPELPLTAGGAVWIYGHWVGYSIPAKVKHAIARKERWDDPTYFARIVLDSLEATGLSRERYLFIMKNYGALREAVQVRQLHRDGVLNRGRIGLHNAERGFPKWVWAYRIP